jgi:DNA-binding NarL/FixJ family response regulator
MFESGKWALLVKLVFLLVIITSITDIAADVRQGANILHIVQESVICVSALYLLISLFINTRAQAKQNQQLVVALDEAKLHSARASQELVKAKRIFGEEISKQFSNWELTESESDVALFTLKGFNAKEIANLRNASEKTVRNQLTSIYKKSTTSSKVSFIAWFMEDLF